MSDDDLIRLLAKKHILGSTPAAVRAALIRRALDEMIKTEFVQKWVATRDLLKGKGE